MTDTRHTKNKSLQNRLSELNNIISSLERSYPYLHEAVETIASLSKSKQDKTDQLHKQIKELNHDKIEITNLFSTIKNSSPSNYYVDLVQSKIARFNDKQNSIRNIKNEIEIINKKINELNNNEFKKYQVLIRERDYVNDELNKMNNDVQRSTINSYEYNKDQVGRALSKVNLLDNMLINIKTKEFDEYCNKYNLVVTDVQPNQKINILSKDNNLTIVVEKNCISATCKTTDTTYIDALIDIYFISLSNDKDIFNHSITHNNPLIRDVVEIKLANRLKSEKLDNQKINGKSVDEIINGKSNAQFNLKENIPDSVPITHKLR